MFFISMKRLYPKDRSSILLKFFLCSHLLRYKREFSTSVVDLDSSLLFPFCL